MSVPATISQVPGYFNYVSKPNQKNSTQLVCFEEIEEALFYPILESKLSGNLCLSCGRKIRNELPLVSDFGEINTPYELIYARLDGLQYAYIS